MNIIRIFHAVLNRLGTVIDVIIFSLIKKPLYKCCYNTNGNSFFCEGVMRKCSVKISGIGNVLIINKGVTLNNMKIEIKGNYNKLVFYENVKFFEGGRIMLEDQNNSIEIGKNSEFVSCFFVVCDNNHKVIIGNDCMFSVNVMIRTSDQHSILNEKGERINFAKDVIVGDRCWVGYGATILKGSILNDGCVIGTESVVGGLYVPKGCIAAGNPAKVIKQKISWSKERL